MASQERLSTNGELAAEWLTNAADSSGPYRQADALLGIGYAILEVADALRSRAEPQAVVGQRNMSLVCSVLDEHHKCQYVGCECSCHDSPKTHQRTEPDAKP